MSAIQSSTGGAAAAGQAPALDVRALVTPARVAAVGLLAVAFGALFERFFRTQHLWSSTQVEDWGHAYIVPFISLYLVWQKRRELSTSPASVFWPGLTPLVLGIMCYFFSVVGIKNHMLQGFSMILSLAGLVLLLLGPRVFRWVFLPIGYLALGVTVSEMIMLKVTFQLQLLASQGAFAVLKLIGAVANFSVDVEGNTLTVLTGSGQEHPLNVAEACSGMRMVVAFVALGGAVALLACREWWQRTALLLLTVPVALLMNVVRVSVLGLLTLVDADLAAGEAHTMIGTVLLLPSLGLFVLVVWALNRAVRDEARPAGPVAGGAP